MEQKTLAESPFLEFSGEGVKGKAYLRPACKVELDVDVTAQMVKEAHGKTIEIVGKEVTIAGFRKGKAPEALVEKNYPKQIESELEKTLASLVSQECMKVSKIPVLNNELKMGYNVKNLSTQEGARISLFFETEPKIPVINPEELSLKTVERPLVNEEKVEETVRQVLLFFAEWTEVKEREVQEGDFVILDVDVIEEDPPYALFSGVRFEVTNRSMAKWMKQLVLGARAGAVIEGISVPDEDAKKEEKEELKPKKVRINIHKIETTKLPELTDTFAQKMGAVSKEDLRHKVEQLLNQKADAHVQEKLREEVCNLLLKDYPFDVPATLIDREVRFRLEQLLQDAEYVAHWNKMTNEAKKRVLSSITEQSEKAVRMFYLCRKILSDAKITISPKDIPQTKDTPLHLLLGERRDAHPQGKDELHQAEALSRLLLEKAEDFLIAGSSKRKAEISSQ